MTIIQKISTVNLKRKIDIFLFFIALVFTYTSCSPCGNWTFQKITHAGPSFTCARMIHSPTQIFNGLTLEFLNGPYGTFCYVSCCAGQIKASVFPHYSSFTLYIESSQFSFWGYLEEGNQRLKLPEEATQLIITAFLNQHNVSIAVSDYYSTFKPDNFSKYYCKFN